MNPFLTNPAPLRPWRWLILSFVLLLACGPHLVVAASGLAGDPDPSFDNDGFVFLNVGPSQTIEDVAVLPDGRIVVVGGYAASGNGQDTWMIVRLLPNGALDPSFANAGVATLHFAHPLGWQSIAHAVVVQPDGKLIVGGAGQDDFVVARYTVDGSLDPTFGTNGLAQTDLSGANLEDTLLDLLLLPDGKIVAGGSTYVENYPHGRLVRYNADGSIDTSFGTDGVATLNEFVPYVSKIARQPDGKLILGATTGISSPQDFVLVRTDAGGEVDPSFGPWGWGLVLTDVGQEMGTKLRTMDSVLDVAIQPDGKIIAVGFSTYPLSSTSSPTPVHQTVIRYDAHGWLDPSFGSDGNGIVVTTFEEESIATAVMIQPDQRIVVLSAVDGITPYGATRYLSDGQLDPSFGNNGYVFGPGAELMEGALQPDGKIVGVGHSMVARLLGASLPAAVTLESFTATPKLPITLEWETSMEVDNLGFWIYRSEGPERPAQPLNAVLIPSQAPGSGQGAAYTWADELVEDCQTYYYWLEAESIQGGRSLHGPIMVELGLSSGAEEASCVGYALAP